MDFQNIINSVKSVSLSVAEKLTPILKESKFKETGVLTPEEFLIAGEHLVHHCPTWQWSTASDPSKVRDFLPADKQFLITRNVPCHKRCKQMEYDASLEKILPNDVTGTSSSNDEEGWVDTHHFSTESTVQSVELSQTATATVDDEEEEAIDLDDLVDSGALEDADDMRYVCEETKPSGDLEKPRTYDLHICYDKFYQVPRLYLMGYDENRKPLSVEQTYEDFSADHANKTITVEAHTSVDVDMPTVHPCRHAEMMKRLIDQYTEAGKDLGVHEYLLLFLKFVQAVIPTIEYDYTRSIQI